MKSNNELVYYLLLAILCTNLTGCGTMPTYKELGSGYVEATYVRTSSWEPSAIRTELRYKRGWSTVLIWSQTDGIVVVVTNDVTVFVGNKARKLPELGERWPMKPRLFAVRAPEPPLDITDELIGRWAQKSGKDIARALKDAWIVGPQEKDDGVNFDFEFAGKDWPEVVVHLSWNQISGIMRDVKENGVEHKDLRWGTSYIEKEFKPQENK